MNRRYINLLSWRFRFILILRERLLLWMIAWVAVCLIAPTLWQIKKQRLRSALNSFTLMESRSAPLNAMQDENRAMTSRLAELKKHQSLLTRLDDQQMPFRLMGLVSHSAQQCSGGIRVNAVAINRVLDELPHPVQTVSNKGKKNKKKAAIKKQELVVLRLNGIANNNLSISKFVAALRDSGVFFKVDLRSSVGARVDDAACPNICRGMQLGERRLVCRDALVDGRSLLIRGR